MLFETFGGLVTITSSTFTTFSALNNDGSQPYQGSLLFSNATGFAMTITSSTIKCASTFTNATIQTNLDAETCSVAGAFYIYNSIVGIISTSNTYMYCQNARQGGIYSIG
jgi:hypothetical protein